MAIPVLEKYEFVPNEADLPLPLAIRLITQIVCENLPQTRTIASVEIIDNTPEPTDLITPFLMQALEDLPLVQSEAKIFCPNPIEIKDASVVSNGNLQAEAKIYTVIVGTNLLEKNQVGQYLMISIPCDYEQYL